MKRYRIIYADPPWRYDDKALERGGAERHYRTMGIDEICALPVREIAAHSSVLLMWVTMPMLEEGLRVMRAWGFKYKTGAFTWVKIAGGGQLSIGMGRHTRANAEVCLLGTRGFGVRRADASIRNTQLHPRARHSQKPDGFRDDIDKLYGPLPSRIELFARKRPRGWDVWGDEVKSDIKI
jgi:N6-adenosine-specific RNA methylase IME4